MSALTRSVPLVALLATSAALAPQHVSAASVEGAFLLNLDNVVLTVETDDDLRSGDVTNLSITGDFSTSNSLTRFRVDAPLGWQASGSLTGANGSGTVMFGETDPTPRAWSGPASDSINNFYNNGTPSLFSLISFFNRTIGDAFEATPVLNGTGATVGGIAGVGWQYVPSASDFTGFVGSPTFGTTSPLTTAGTFTLTIDDPDGRSDFLDLLDGLNFAYSSNGTTGLSASFSAAPVPSPIPVPAALPLLAAGIGLLGIVGWRRRRAAA